MEPLQAVGEFSIGEATPITHECLVITRHGQSAFDRIQEGLHGAIIASLS